MFTITTSQVWENVKSNMRVYDVWTLHARLPMLASKLVTNHSHFSSAPTPRLHWESGYYCIRAYLSFIQHKSPDIVCTPEVIFLIDLTLALHYWNLVDIISYSFVKFMTFLVSTERTCHICDIIVLKMHLCWLYINDSKLVYLRFIEMNWQQTYRGQVLRFKWMRGTLVCDHDSLSPPHCGLVSSFT